MSAIRALPVRQVKDVLGEKGYHDLVRFLARIEQTDWYEVPLMHNERPGGSSGRRGRRGACAGWSPGRRGYGSDYLYIDLKSVAEESAWTEKRRRVCMYGPENPFTQEREHRRRMGHGPRTFDDAERAAADALPSYEEAQDRTERARIGQVEVIVTSDEEVSGGPVMESGGPATLVSTVPGSGDASEHCARIGRRQFVWDVRDRQPGALGAARLSSRRTEFR